MNEVLEPMNTSPKELGYTEEDFQKLTQLLIE